VKEDTPKAVTGNIFSGNFKIHYFTDY